MTVDDPSTETEFEGSGNSEPRRRVLYPIIQSESDGILHVAAALAAANDAELVVGYVPEETTDFVTKSIHEIAKTVFRSSMDSAISVDVTGHELDGSDPASAILSAAKAYDIDAIVMGTDPNSIQRTVANGFDDDLLVVTNERLLASIASILLPVSPDDRSDAAVDVAGALARASGASVEVVHVVGPDESSPEHADRAFETAVSRLSGIDIVDTRLLSGESVAATVGEESKYHDLTVVEASHRSQLRRRFFGSTAGEIGDRARNTVVTVRPGGNPEVSLLDR